MNGMEVSWCAKKQGGVSLSTIKAKFVADGEVAREMIGLRQLLMEICVAPFVPMLLHVYDQAAISQIEGEASTTKAKHIDVRHKFVKDYAQRGIIRIQHVRSELMLADPTTKTMDAVKLDTLRGLMSLA